MHSLRFTNRAKFSFIPSFRLPKNLVCFTLFSILFALSGVVIAVVVTLSRDLSVSFASMGDVNNCNGVLVGRDQIQHAITTSDSFSMQSLEFSQQLLPLIWIRSYAEKGSLCQMLKTRACETIQAMLSLRRVPEGKTHLRLFGWGWPKTSAWDSNLRRRTWSSARPIRFTNFVSLKMAMVSRRASEFIFGESYRIINFWCSRSRIFFKGLNTPRSNMTGTVCVMRMGMVTEFIFSFKHVCRMKTVTL